MDLSSNSSSWDGSSMWDDIVLALVRADEFSECKPQAGFTQRSLRLVRTDERIAAANRSLVVDDRRGQRLLYP